MFLNSFKHYLDIPLDHRIRFAMGLLNMYHWIFLSQTWFESLFLFHRHNEPYRSIRTMLANHSIHNQLKETIAKKGYIIIYPFFLCHYFRVILQHEHIWIAVKNKNKKQLWKWIKVYLDTLEDYSFLFLKGFLNMSRSNFLSQILFEFSFSFHRHKKLNIGTMVANYSIHRQLKEIITKSEYNTFQYTLTSYATILD